MECVDRRVLVNESVRCLPTMPGRRAGIRGEELEGMRSGVVSVASLSCSSDSNCWWMVG